MYICIYIYIYTYMYIYIYIYICVCVYVFNLENYQHFKVLIENYHTLYELVNVDNCDVRHYKKSV